MKKILIINPYLSGISGNMMLGALVDLGADEKKLDRVAKAVSARLDCRVKWKKKRKEERDVSTLWIDSSIEGEFKRYGIDDVKAFPVF